MPDPDIFNFDRDVWSDQRRALRATGKKSIWYRIIKALSILLLERAERAVWLRKQIFLDTSDGYGLTLWGQRYEIPRYYGESDDDYRNRIISERMIARGDASNASRKKILNVVFGINPSDVQILRIYDYHFSVGGISDRGNEPSHKGAIGSVVSTRDYAVYTYRIYAPLPEDLEMKLKKALSMMRDINIGGNYWELWFEKGNQSGLQTETDDRQLNADASFQLRKYEIY